MQSILKKIKLKKVAIELFFIKKKFNLINVIKKTQGTNSKKRGCPIIISLTSYHKRIDIVYLTIETLLNQTVKPDRIILWLSEDDLKGKRIPKELLRQVRRGLEVKVVKENMKSYKKLIYLSEEMKKNYIVTCDDDTFYPNWFLEKLYDKAKKYSDNIVAYRCSIIEKKTEKQLVPYIKWNNATNIINPSFKIFPTGVGGVIYPPKSLNRLVSEKRLFMKLAPTGDDIWFKAMALLNNKKTITVLENSIEFPTIPHSQENALWKTNVLENKNDEQLKKVFDYFNLYEILSN